MEPVLEERDTEKQAHSTPTKVKIQGAIEFLEADEQKDRKRDVFKYFDVEHTQSYKILNDKHTNRRLQHDSTRKDSREGFKKLTKKNVDRLEEIVQI